MRSLPGNDASVFIAEMMGNGAYQLSPGKSVLFKAGRISGVTDAPARCGCPEPKAGTPAPAPAGQASTAAIADSAKPLMPSIPTKATASSAASAPPNTADPSGAHLEVESSFVYRGNAAAQDYYESVARLSISADNSRLALALLPTVSGPVEATKPPVQNKGMLHRLGHFLGRLLGK